MFVVPTPLVPFGTCDQTYYYSSYWPGIDGNGGAGLMTCSRVASR
jgi:hypothetical protein